MSMWEGLPPAVRHLLPLTAGCISLAVLSVWLWSEDRRSGPPLTNELKQAYELCAPERQDDLECGKAMHRLKPRWGTLFQALPVITSSQGNKQWTALTLNTHALGIECLRFANTKYAESVAFAVAVPEHRRVRWYLGPGAPWNPDAQRYVPFESAIESPPPWPSTHRATVFHEPQLVEGEHLLCVTLPMQPTEPVVVYAAAAFYDKPAIDSADGITVQLDYDTSDLIALGLRPNDLPLRKVQAALESANVAAVKQLLARGVPLQSRFTPAPLITALRGRWPLDELGELLRAGAKPNAVADGTTSLCALALRTQDQPDDAVGAAAKLLLEAGADVNAPDSKGLTPMHCAMQHNASSMMSELAGRLPRGSTFVAPP